MIQQPNHFHLLLNTHCHLRGTLWISTIRKQTYQMSTGLQWVCYNGIGVFKLLFIDFRLVLHPQMKLKYFKQHKWSKDWIDTAKDIVREEFAKYKVAGAAVAASHGVCHRCCHRSTL